MARWPPTFRNVAPFGLSRKPAARRAHAFDLYSRGRAGAAPADRSAERSGNAQGITAARPGRQARLEDL